jgi:hypothetical protein
MENESIKELQKVGYLILMLIAVIVYPLILNKIWPRNRKKSYLEFIKNKERKK